MDDHSLAVAAFVCALIATGIALSDRAWTLALLCAAVCLVILRVL